MQITEHFSLQRLVHSDTARERGINNTPPDETLPNLRCLAEGLEQIQALLGYPLTITSAYRCAELNRAVGGSPASQHVSGLAADFTCPEFGSPMEIALAIGDSGISFDQCILEFGRWVHLSFSNSPRERLLTIHNTATGYLEGLWDREGKRLA